MPPNPIPGNEEPSPIFKIVIIVIVIAILVSALAAAFIQVTSAPLLTQPIKPHNNWSVVDPNLREPDIVYQDPDELDLLEENLGNEELFTSVTSTDLAYLRTAVYDSYSHGTWTTQATYSEYNGSEMDIGSSSSNRTIQTAQIIPFGKLYGGLPVAKQTFQLLPIKPGTVKYSVELGAFQSSVPVSTNYTATYYKESISLEELQVAVAAGDARYLQVPYELEARIKELTDFVTTDTTNDYDKIMAIRAYLRENYQYELDHPKPDSKTDPVEFFLFTSKQGICTYFNSALVLMLRSAGIHSRMVVGFMIDPTSNYQNVTAGEAHAYAEVKFDGRDWMIVDALGWWDDLDRSLISVPSLEISGKVFQDDNANGIDDDDNPLEYADVAITDLTRNVTSMVSTDMLGHYSRGLWPGEYEVSLDMGEGWLNTTEGIVQVILEDRDCDGIDFGAFPILQIPTEPTTTNITFINSRAALMTRFNVIGIVEDGSGAPLSNLQVRVYVTKEKQDGFKVYCGKAWVRDGSFNASCVMPNIELGMYQVVAQCTGNQQYMPSWSDPEIRVVDDTRISIAKPNGQIAAFPGQFLSFQISVSGKYRGMVVTSSWLNISTDESGYEEVERVKLDEFGIGYYSLTRFVPSDLTIKVSFVGTDDLIAASTRFAVHFGYVHLSMSTTKLIRGESNILSGKATVGGVPLTGLPVYCRLEEEYGSWAQTDSKGSFAAQIAIPSQRELGPNDIEVVVGDFESEQVHLTIVSRTTMTAILADGKVSAKLVDDKSTPLSQMQIRLSSSKGNLTSITDANGVASFTNLPAKSENLTLLFLGADEYLTSTTRMFYSPTNSVDNTYSLIALALVSAFVVLAYTYSVSGRKMKLPKMRKKSLKPVAKRAGPYTFEYPQIPKGLPPVWHQGEELLLRIRGKEGRVSLSINGRKQSEITLVDGIAEVPLFLPLGKHQLIVSGRDGQSEEIIKVTFYGEEMVHLYSETLHEMSISCSALSDDLTPREAQSVLSNRLGQAKGGALDLMTTLFERAEFGPEAMGRLDYEMMFEAVKEVRA
jgi:transglutaminase-like putative cysteine protease